MCLLLSSYQAGESWTNVDCSQYCTCEDGQAHCPAFACGDNQVCDIKNGIPSCYCEDGFTLQGDGCVRGEPGSLGMGVVRIFTKYRTMCKDFLVENQFLQKDFLLKLDNLPRTPHIPHQAKKKNCYVALTRPKFENWVGRSIFFIFLIFLTYRERVEFSNFFLKVSKWGKLGRNAVKCFFRPLNTNFSKFFAQI